MKILVTGAGGMLGRDVVQVFRDASIDVVGYTKLHLDITNPEDVIKIINVEAPTHIINCAAYTKVDDAEEHREECFRVNVTGVQNLIQVCQGRKIKLIQISTDYVFDGSKQNYTEDEPVRPLNYYGLTKSQSEIAIQEQLTNYAIVRTSWLYGHQGSNFVETIIKRAGTHDEIKVVDDQMGSPTYTIDFVLKLVEVLSKESGIYHISNQGMCSWFEFASTIVALRGLECLILPCTSVDYYQKATRPKYSVLKSTKLSATRHWRDALEEYINNVI